MEHVICVDYGSSDTSCWAVAQIQDNGEILILDAGEFVIEKLEKGNPE